MKKKITKVAQFIKNEITAYQSDRERYNELLGIRSQYFFDQIQYFFKHGSKGATKDRKVVVHRDGTETVHIRLSSADSFVAYNTVPNKQKPDEQKRRLVAVNERIYVKNLSNKIVSMHTAEEYYKAFAIGGEVQKLSHEERYRPTWSAVPAEGPVAIFAKVLEDEEKKMASIIEVIAPDTAPEKVEYPAKELTKKSKQMSAYGTFTNVPGETPVVRHKKPTKSPMVLFIEKMSTIKLMTKKALDDFRIGIKSLPKVKRHKKQKLSKDSVFLRMNH